MTQTLPEQELTRSVSPSWALFEVRQGVDAVREHPVRAERVVDGRSSEADVSVDSPSVSKRHAEVRLVDGRPVVRDLGSTNDTFVNGRPATESSITDQDLVQFADRLFRVKRLQTQEYAATYAGGALSFAASLIQFEELMSGRGLHPTFSRSSSSSRAS